MSTETWTRRITCPDCGRPNVALTKLGRIKQHNDRDKTARLRARTGHPFDRELCESYLLTPEAVASSVTQEVKR